MKTISVFALILLSAPICFAQNFTSLGTNDPADATSTTGGDIKSVEYAMDIAKDSIWFRIVSHNTLSNFTYYIFCDSDLNTSNGFSIDQPMSPPPHPNPNTSMKMDNRFMWCGRLGSFVTGEIEKWSGTGGSQSSPANVTIVNGTTVIVGGLLSDFDTLVSDNMMNVVVSSSGNNNFFGGIIDYYPDNSYVALPLSTSVAEQKQSKVVLTPNPSQGLFKIRNAKNVKRVVVYNISGQKVKEVQGNTSVIDMTSFQKGIYLAMITDQQGKTSSEKLIIQ